MNLSGQLALAVTLLAVPAAAQPVQHGAPQETRPAPAAFDEARAARALEYGRAEEAYAHLAIERTSSERTREFARRMVDEHARFNAELSRFAAQAAPLREEDQAVLERLRTLGGAAFEQVYIRDRAQERMRHYNLVSELAAQAGDPDLRRIAAAMVPVLGRQLEQAQALREDVRPIGQGPVGAVPGQSEPPAGTVGEAPERASPPAQAPKN
jgi:putative membrane protein